MHNENFTAVRESANLTARPANMNTKRKKRLKRACVTASAALPFSRWIGGMVAAPSGAVAAGANRSKLKAPDRMRKTFCHAGASLG